VIPFSGAELPLGGLLLLVLYLAGCRAGAERRAKEIRR